MAHLRLVGFERQTYSLRSFCPSCGIERTGDSLLRPCACMSRTIVHERMKRLTPRIVGFIGDVFASFRGMP